MRGGQKLMLISELSAPGAKKSRLRKYRGQGRRGKTGGRGMKGQRSRSGGKNWQFIGGQTPLYRQIPKMGFRSRKEYVTEEIRSSELNKLLLTDGEVVTVDLLKQFNLIKKQTKYVEVFLSGTDVNKHYQFSDDIRVSKGVTKQLGQLNA